jgi:pimeloyl-ACP methyl ester carboxylesterase
MSDQVQVNDVTFHVDDSGSGPPVVFLHGCLMSGRFFQRQVPHFSRAYRVVIPDLRGHGRSEKVLHGHTVANYARDLKALCEALQIARPVLVGWSMGAMVAYEYLKLVGQDAVAGLVIVEQAPSDFQWEGYEFGGFTPASLGQFVEDLQMDLPAVARGFAEWMLKVPTLGDVAWMADEITRVPPVIASTILVNQTLRDDRVFIATIRLPTLVLFRSDDTTAAPKAGAYIAHQIPGGQLCLFEHSSHCPFYEEPDLFNAVLSEFLAQVTGA